MLKVLGTAAAISVLATTGFAQSLPAGFYMDGKVQVDHMMISGGGDITMGLIDVTLGYSNAGNGVPIGIEFDIYSLQLEDINVAGYTGSIYYDSNFGRISVGLPLAAIDDYVATSTLAKQPYLDLFLFTQTGSLSQKMTRSSFFFGSQNYEYGARFDGEFGGAKYGLSYHSFENDDLINAAVSYDFADNYNVGFGIENTSGSNIYTGSLSANYDDLGAVFIIKHMEGFGGTTYTLEGSYNVFDSVDLTVGYSAASAGGFFGDDVAYADAQYSFMEDGYIGVSVASFADSSDPFYTVYAGWNVNFGG